MLRCADELKAHSARHACRLVRSHDPDAAHGRSGGRGGGEGEEAGSRVCGCLDCGRSVQCRLNGFACLCVRTVAAVHWADVGLWY